MSARKEVDKAFKLIDRVLSPLTKGDGEKAAVVAARVALQSAYQLRQWARVAAAIEDAKPPPAKPKSRSRNRTPKGRTQ